jgi:peptide/nickel transport system substrate-binding protein
MRRSKSLSIVAVACAISALAACDSGNGKSSNSGKSAAATSAASASGGSVAPSNAKAGGTLTYGYTGGGLTSLNPNTINSATEKPVASLLFDGLTQLGPDGSVQPDLATSWTASSDQKTWTFTLRSGVKYHSGKTFTAQDAVKNINYVLDKKNASSQRKRIAAIASATAKDDTTLVINLSQPDAVLPSALMWIYMSNIDTIASVNHDGDGTGPYELKSFVPDDHVDLVRFDGYWGTKPKIDGIKIERTADATSALTSLQTGQIDVLWGVDPTNVGTLKSDANLTFLKSQSTSGTSILMLDMTSPPFNNIKARQALSYAVDRKGMADAGYNGIADVSMANDPVDSNSPDYDSSLPKYDFNLDKAKQLFAEAGVKQGSTLTFWTLAGRRGEWTTMGQILQADLKKIGINLQIQQEETSTWVAKFAPYGKKYPNMMVMDFLSFPPVPAFALQFFTTGGCECNFASPQYDALMQQALAATSDQARKAAEGQMQQIFNQQVPAVVLMQNATLVAAQKKVQGVWLEGDGTPRLAQGSLS